MRPIFSKTEKQFLKTGLLPDGRVPEPAYKKVLNSRIQAKVAQLKEEIAFANGYGFDLAPIVPQEKTPQRLIDWGEEE